MAIIFLVDDEDGSGAGIIARKIESLTQGDVLVRVVKNVVISGARETLKEEMSRLTEDDGGVKCFLIDLVDTSAHQKNAGALLLDSLQADPETSDVPVIIYHTRYLEVDIPDLKKRGAKAFIQREIHESVLDLASRVLQVLQVPIH